MLGRFIAGMALLTTTSAVAQTVTQARPSDVVVMRRAITSARVSGASSQQTYAWHQGDWSSWSDSCSTTAVRVRQITCIRNGSVDDVVEDARCQGDKPASQESTSVTSSCTEAIDDGSFEGTAAGVTKFRVDVRVSPTGARTGTHYATIFSSPGQRHTSAEMAFGAKANSKYRFSFWARQDGAGPAHIAINRLNGSGYTVQSVDLYPGTGWTEGVLIYDNTGRGATTVQMSLYSDGNNVSIDDVSAMEMPR